MSITAHLLQEDIISLCQELDESDPEQFLEKEYLACVNSGISQAHKFEFDFVPEQELIEFATDCVRNSLFKLPFSNVYFEIPFLHKVGMVAVCASQATSSTVDEIERFTNDYSSEYPGDEAQARNVVDNIKNLHEMNGVCFNVFYKLSGGNLWNLMCDGYFRRFTEEEAELNPGVHFKCSMGNRLQKFKNKCGSWSDFPESFREFGEIGVYLFLGAWSALNSKSTITQENREPKNLNKARLRKGRLPLFGFKKVTLKVPNHQGWDGRPLGGTHASPRMHWRRGHLRHLAEDKIIPISPCLVGAAEDGIILKEYRATLASPKKREVPLLRGDVG